MKAIQFFQREHQALLGVADRLVQVLAREERDEWQVLRVLRCVEDLRLATLLHVVVEDGDFYPRVNRCGHPELAERTRHIGEKAGHITDHFDQFIQAWSKKRAIKEYNLLCQETRHLLTLLEERVREEEAVFVIIESLNLDLQSIQSDMDFCRADRRGDGSCL